MGFQNIIKSLKSNEQNLNYKLFKQNPLSVKMFDGFVVYRCYNNKLGVQCFFALKFRAG